MALLITPGIDLVKRLKLAAADEGGKIEVYNKNGTLTAGVRVDYPPYNCVTTGLRTKGVEDFGSAWANCTSITEFPLLDVSNGTNFQSSWDNCSSLTSFPLVDVSSGTNFSKAWYNCNNLTSFPELDLSSGENFSETWYNCTSLTSFPNINLSSGINFSRAWMQCSSLASFPPIDFSSATSLAEAWTYTSLTSFPVINCSNVEYFSFSWAWCPLTSFPSLNFTSGTSFYASWYSCYSLTSFPAGVFDSCPANNYSLAWQNCALSQQSVDNILISIDTAGQLNGTLGINGGTSSEPSYEGWYRIGSLQAKGWTVSVNGTPPAAWPPTLCNTNVNTYGTTSFANAWYNCQGITNFPLLYTKNITSMEGAWRASGLTSFPLIDTSNVTNFETAWYWCRSLSTFPLIDTSKATNFSSAWDGCWSLTSFPLLNTSKVTNFSGSWYFCYSLTSFPAIDTSKGINFSGTWSGCSGLISFPALDFSSGLYFNRAWQSCNNITSFPYVSFNPQAVFSSVGYNGAWEGCTNLTTFPANMFDNCQTVRFDKTWTNCALTQQSVDNILISIDTAGQLNGTLGINGGTSSSPSYRGWYSVASLQAKGWTVSVNGTPPAAWPPTLCNTNVNTYGTTSFANAWSGCTSITSFPSLYTNNIVNFSNAWYNCSSLTSFPLIDTSKAIALSGTWQQCSSLTSFPLLDTSKCTSLIATWSGCSSLTSFPLIDTSSVTQLFSTWTNCSSLTLFPLLDFSETTSFAIAWSGCQSLTEFPLIDTSKGQNFTITWHTCTSLTSFPQLNLSSGTTFYWAWLGCTSLVNFPANMFDTCNATSFSEAWYNCSLNQQSVDNILISIDTAGRLNGTLGINGGTSSEPSYEGWYRIGSLQAKGWTVSVNGTPPAAWPPTSCNTNVQTYGVTSFYSAWSNCQSLTSFPMMNTSNVTDFGAAWQNCRGLTSFPLLDMRSAYSLAAAWVDCRSLTSFPALNTGTVTQFSQTWMNCYGLTSFPALDMRNGSNFQATWAYCIGLTQFPLINLNSNTSRFFVASWTGCINLTSFPSLNFNSSTSFLQAWNGCTSLTTFPPGLFNNCTATNYSLAWQNCALSQQSVDNILISIDTAGRLNGTLGINGGTSSTPSLAGWAAVISLEQKGWTVSVNGTKPCFQPPYNCSTKVNPSCVTNLSLAWFNCTSLTSFPLIDTSSATNLYSAWSGCTNLTSFAAINTSNVTNFQQAWVFCGKLTSFPSIDTSNGTNFSVAWRGCTSLASFPLLDTSKGIDFSQAWTDCYLLTSFPLIDTSSGTKFDSSWVNCGSLTSFPALNLSKGESFTGTWTRCYNLVNFPANMFDTCNATNFYNAWTYCKLSQQSVDNILVSLDTAGKLNGIVDIYEGTSAYPSPVGVQAMNNLVSKGWVVTVNSNNYIPYPSDFQNWQITSGSIATNVGYSPTGVGIADRWTESTQPDSNGQRRLYYDLGSLNPPIVGTTCTLSIFVSRWNSNSPRNIALTFDDGVGMKFDLTTPSNSSVFQLSGFYEYVSSKVETIGSQWYKCTLVFNLISTTGTQRRVGIRMLDSSLNENYTGDGSRLTLYRALLTN